MKSSQAKSSQVVLPPFLNFQGPRSKVEVHNVLHELRTVFNSVSRHVSVAADLHRIASHVYHAHAISRSASRVERVLLRTVPLRQIKKKKSGGAHERTYTVRKKENLCSVLSSHRVLRVNGDGKNLRGWWTASLSEIETGEG